MCVPWCIHMCVTSHSYVCHDAWLIHTCAISHTHVCHISFIRLSYRIHMCAMTHSYVCHISFTCVPWLIYHHTHSSIYLTVLIYFMRAIWNWFHAWHTGTWWRRPIGCLKLQVIFRKRAHNYRALLWKMTCKGKASYGSSPPCTDLLHVCHDAELMHMCAITHSHVCHDSFICV